MAERRPETPSTWRLASRLAMHRPGLFAVATVGWVAYFTSPVLLGLTLRAVFDAIADEGSGARPYALVAVYAGIELVRRLVVHGSALLWVRMWVLMEAVQQANMLDAQVASGGPHAAASLGRPGEALSRFRDDPDDAAWFVDVWLDTTGAALFAILATAVMVTVDARMTVLVLVPMALVALTTRVVGAAVQRAHRADLEATSRVTSILRDAFQAVQTVRLGGADDDVVAEIDRRCAERRRTAVRDRVLSESIGAVSLSSTGLAVGLVLLLAAGSMRSGNFSVGDLALFTTYLGYFAFLPRMLGHLMTRHRQATVALDRMSELTGGRAADVVRSRRLAIDSADPDPEAVAPPVREPLAHLTVEALTRRHAGGGGVEDVSFHLERGTVTVVQGPVGSGKTTLLRALLGLVDATGTVRWNGRTLVDRAAALVPPRVAYLSQVPQLFSDTIADNVLLGLDGDDRDVADALATSQLADDVATMPAGPATLVGPRGLRLSGGQRQRLAAARALVRRPELLVIDDVSSALDIETELALWDALAAAGTSDGTTVLAVSNRPIAAARADQLLVLDDGRLTRGGGGRP